MNLSGEANKVIDDMNDKEQLSKFIKERCKTAHKTAVKNAVFWAEHYTKAKAMKDAIEARAVQAVGFKAKSKSWLAAEKRFNDRKKNYADKMTEFQDKHTKCK